MGSPRGLHYPEELVDRHLFEVLMLTVWPDDVEVGVPRIAQAEVETQVVGSLITAA